MPNRVRKVDCVINRVPLTRVHPDKLRPVPHLNGFENPQILPLPPLPLHPAIQNRFHIRPRASIQNRHLKVIDFDNHVIDAQPDQRRKQMLRGRNQNALPHQTRGIRNFRHIPPGSRNLKVVQIRPPKHNPRPRRCRHQPQRHLRSGVQPHPTEPQRSVDRLLELRLSRQGSYLRRKTASDAIKTQRTSAPIKSTVAFSPQSPHPPPTPCETCS